jgi:hypothetical protein
MQSWRGALELQVESKQSFIIVHLRDGYADRCGIVWGFLVIVGKSEYKQAAVDGWRLRRSNIKY